MSNEHAILSAMSADVQQRLAPVVASFGKVVSSIEQGQRLLPPSENIISYTTIYNIATDQRYDAAYQNASKKLSELLYGHFQEILAGYARQLATASSASTDKFAKVHAWGKFRTASKWACVVFRYLGCFFLNDSKGGSKYPPLDDVARAVFYNCCLKKHLAETRRVVFDLIAGARDGDQIIVDLLKASVDMFERMNIPSQPTFFEEQFLVPFAEATRDYYERWSSSRVHRCSASEYIQMCGRALHAEADRFRLLFLARHHRGRLLDEVEMAILDSRAARDLMFKSETGLRSLLRMRDFATASMAFKLLTTKNKRVEPIAEIVGQQIEEDGRAQLDAKRGEVDLNPHDCVSKLFELHETYTKLLSNYFNNNVIIARSVQSSLERVMSEGFKTATAGGGNGAAAVAGGGTIPVSEILAQYCDYCIRQQDKITMPLEESFDQAVALLMFTTSKDLFQLRAKELLSKRLLAPNALSTSSAVEAAEQLLVSRLKRACGSQFTSQYESMLADRASSGQLQSRFVAYTEARGIRLPIDFSALILKNGIWPCKVDDKMTLSIPREVAIGIKHYIDFYRQEGSSNKRVLRWLHNHSNAVITSRFPKGLKELTMTAYQAGVLLAFNNNALSAAPSSSGAPAGFKTIKEIKASTNLDDDQIKRALQSFCRAKVLMLSSPQQHQSMGAPPGTVFCVNDQFSSQNRKMVIPAFVPRTNAVAATEALQAQANEQRKPVIQASLVKLMKSRRQMPHQELMAESLRYLSSLFVPEPSAVKEQIGVLIERDIIKRHPTEHGVYIYVA